MDEVVADFNTSDVITQSWDALHQSSQMCSYTHLRATYL